MARINPIQLQKFLRGVDYPVQKSDLVNAAQREGADENALDTLKALPQEKFNSPNDVSEAVGRLE
jgi:hypothetical protein